MARSGSCRSRARVQLLICSGDRLPTWTRRAHASGRWPARAAGRRRRLAPCHDAARSLKSSSPPPLQLRGDNNVVDPTANDQLRRPGPGVYLRGLCGMDTGLLAFPPDHEASLAAWSAITRSRPKLKWHRFLLELFSSAADMHHVV